MSETPWFGVLVDKETGAELNFQDRGDYNATFYAGGYREKFDADEGPQTSPPTPPAAAPRPAPPQPVAPRPAGDS